MAGSAAPRILYLGNGDNIGVRLVSAFRDFGLDAQLWRTDPGGPDEGLRGNPANYLGPDFSNVKNWVLDFPSDDRTIQEFSERTHPMVEWIESKFDLVFASGIKGFLMTAGLRSKTVLVPSGYEVTFFLRFWDRSGDKAWPHMIFDHLIRKRLGQLFRYRAWVCGLNRRAIMRATLVLDSCAENMRLYHSLDRSNELGSRVRQISIVEEPRRLWAVCDPKRSKQLQAELGSFQRVFLWLSRVNFKDPKSILYKGVERFMEGLLQVLPDLAAGKIALVMVRHGEDFADFLKRFGDHAAFRWIRWVPHLKDSDLVAHLSLPNTVLFSEFGPLNVQISGISRVALALGTPFVSSVQPDQAIPQYGAPSPSLFAMTGRDLGGVMRRIVDMEEDDFKDWRQNCADFAKIYCDPKRYVQRLLGDLGETIHV